MNAPLVFNEIWRDQALDILEFLSISDSRLLDDTSEFWRRVSLSLKVNPKYSEIENAKACVEQTGGVWEDDYVIDGQLDKDAVFSELLSSLADLTSEELDELLKGERQSEFPIDDDTDLGNAGLKHTTIVRRVGDIVNDIMGGLIRLNPKWQRQFVWPTKKSQRYIESLLLDIPTPSILLYHQGEGTLGMPSYQTVVDGRQRLETLLRFISTAEQLKQIGFTNRRFKTPKSGDNDFKSFNLGGDLYEYSDKYYVALDQAVQDNFKAREIPVTGIRAKDRKMLYHIFGRYNTGSEKLNPAEVRNAVYQEVPIHNTLWELARESHTSTEDGEEASGIEQLKLIMGKKKRYGTYDFIGRVMAFTYLNISDSDAKPSANEGTRQFYDNFETLHGDHAKLRRDFIQAFYKVVDWYPVEYTFVKPPSTVSESLNSRFHSWAATVQMSTAHHLRIDIENKLLDENKLVAAIESEWSRFAGIDPVERRTYMEDEVGGEDLPEAGLFQSRQNATNFWRSQQEWLQLIRTKASANS